MPLSTVDPTPALLVVDLQAAIVALGVPGTEEVVARSARLAAAFRSAGHPVVLVNVDTSPDGRSDHNPAGGGTRMAGEQIAFVPELGQAESDLVVTKLRYSAFIQGASDLEMQLRARDIDTVLITGTVTNVCCESTARDAMMRNFRTIMVSDGNAANTDAEHANSLIAFYLSFGDVETADAIVRHIGAGASTAAVAAE